MEKKVIVSTTRIEAFVEKSFSTIRNNCFFLQNNLKRCHYTDKLLLLAKKSKMVLLYEETASSGKKKSKMVSLYGETASSGKKIKNGFFYEETLLLVAEKSKMVSTSRKNCFFCQKI